MPAARQVREAVAVKKAAVFCYVKRRNKKFIQNFEETLRDLAMNAFQPNFRAI